MILTVFVFEKVLDYFESKWLRFAKRFDKTYCQIEKSLDYWQRFHIFAVHSGMFWF